MRPMIFEFPEDRTCDYLERQYMFGDRLLVAPIFNSESTVDYYLPKGKWTNLLTNEIIDGGTWINQKFDFLTLPLMVMENSIIPMGTTDNCCDYDYTEDLQLHIFNLVNKASVDINDTKGNIVLQVNVERTNRTIKIKLSNNHKNIRVVMHNIHNIKNINGARVESSENGSVLSILENAVEVIFDIL